MFYENLCEQIVGFIAGNCAPSAQINVFLCAIKIYIHLYKGGGASLFVHIRIFKCKFAYIFLSVARPICSVYNLFLFKWTLFAHTTKETNN